MAHLQGTDYVGSMVVLEDGLPNKREYRRFKVHVPGNDDYAAMEEVLTRRLTAYLAAAATRRRSSCGRARRRSSPTRRSCCSSTAARASSAWPSRSSTSSACADEIPVAGLAKRFEQVYVPGQVDAGRHPAGERGAVHAPAHPRRGPPLRQHVPRRAAQQADDARAPRRHRRPRRDARKRLVKELGGVNAVKRASLEQLQALRWLPNSVATAVYERFHNRQRRAAATP